MRAIILIALVATSLLGESITWTKYTIPAGCSDSATPPCIWPAGQGFNNIIPNPTTNSVLMYSTRQASTGTVTVSGGTNVAWVSGDHFGPTWGLATGDVIAINGVNKTIAQGSVTSTSLTLTTSATNGTFTYSAAAGALTMASDLYDYHPSTHTFTFYAGGNATLTNSSGNLETDAHLGSWPADRQPNAQLFYDSSRSAVWMTGGINGGKPWNCATNGTANCNASQFEQTTWKGLLSGGAVTWTGIASTHHPINSSSSMASAIDTDHQIILHAGYDGGPGFRTAIFCPTDRNPTPGTLTSSQTSAGCTIADDWVPTVSTNTTSMPALSMPTIVYSPTAQKFVLFGGANSNTIYTYTPLTKAWATLTNSSCSAVPAPRNTGNPYQPGIALLSDGRVFYHYYGTTAATNQEWAFNASTGTCAQIPAFWGGGPSSADGSSWNTQIAYESSTNTIVAFPQGGNYVWEGHFDPTPGSLSTALTVEESLFLGGSTGVARTNEPFCMGVPIPDSLNIRDPQTLALTVASAAQFRVLGRWPSGSIKWVKVCGILPSLSAGGTASITLSNTGSGNTGGSDLATDNGTTITVATGTSTFGIKKANFNGLDTAVVGSTTLLSTSTASTRGLIIVGPDPTATYPANVTCGSGAGQTPCTNVYSSANDSSSTCVIEENGPVIAILKCTGTFYDSSGTHPYMHFTVRETFSKNKNSVKVTAIRRNADYDTAHQPSQDCAYTTSCQGNTFNTSFKGFSAYELRLNTALTGTLTYLIATDGSGSTSTSTLSQSGGTDSAYIYQGQSTYMITDGGAPPAACDVGSTCANYYTTDNGGVVVKNASNQGSTNTPAGWADIRNSSGAGVLIGHYQMAAYWPKSLEFDLGGADVRLGFGPSMNGAPTAGPENGTKDQYQCWPCWDITDSYIEFHSSALSSPLNSFLSLQHPLLVRPASLAYLNSTGVLPYPVVDPTVENSYYYAVQQAASPAVPLSDFCWGGSLVSGSCIVTPDRGIGTVNGVSLTAQSQGIYAHRQVAWTTSGPMNQTEFRWSDMVKFLQQGYTGRWINSTHWYKYMMGNSAWPHSDGTNTNGTDATINGFLWSTRRHANQSQPELDTQGLPTTAAGGGSSAKMANSSLSYNNWMVGANGDQLHYHWDGMLDYYFLTGDETIKEAIAPWKAFYMNTDTYQGGTLVGFKIARAIGIQLRTASRFGEYLAAIGDSDSTTVLNNAATHYTLKVHPDPCMSGYPSGCTAPNPILDANADPVGISRTRGQAAGSRVSGGWCPDNWGSSQWRIDQPFETAIEIEGILAVARAKGPTWTYYNEALDLAYGAAQGQIFEGFNDDGTARWSVAGNLLYNGFRYLLVLDRANACDANTANGSGTYTTADGTNIVLSGLTATSFWDPPFQDATHGAQFDGGYNVTAVADSSHITISPSIGIHGSPTAVTMNSSVVSVGGTLYDNYTFATGNQTLWPIFYSLRNTTGDVTAWKKHLDISLVRMTHGRSVWPADFGNYQMGSLIYYQNNPGTSTLNDLSFSISDLGSGNYQLTFTPPSDAAQLRIKWSPKTIAPSSALLGYDNLAQTFSLTPATYMTWMGANTVTEPSPTPGSSQSVTVATATTGLSAANFSVKVYTGSSSPPTGAPTIYNGSMIRGASIK